MLALLAAWLAGKCTRTVSARPLQFRAGARFFLKARWALEPPWASVALPCRDWAPKQDGPAAESVITV